MLGPSTNGMTIPPPGAPPGGYYMQDTYCGGLTICIGIVVCWFTFCGCLMAACPLDKRLVYMGPNGQKYRQSGQPIS